MSARHRTHGRVNAAKAHTLKFGFKFQASDGTKYAQMRSTRKRMSGPIVRVPVA